MLCHKQSPHDGNEMKGGEERGEGREREGCLFVPQHSEAYSGDYSYLLLNDVDIGQPRSSYMDQ